MKTFHSKQNFILNVQLKWKLLKYEIPKLTIKTFAKNGKKTKHS